MRVKICDTVWQTGDVCKLHDLVQLQNGIPREDRPAHQAIIPALREWPLAEPVPWPRQRIGFDRSCWFPSHDMNHSNTITLARQCTTKAYGHEREQSSWLSCKRSYPTQSNYHATFHAKPQGTKCLRSSCRQLSLPLPPAMLLRPSPGLQASANSRRGACEPMGKSHLMMYST